MGERRDFEFNDFDINQFDIDNFFIINDSEFNTMINKEDYDTNVQIGTVGSTIENIQDRTGLEDGGREGGSEEGREGGREGEGDEREGEREGGREGGALRGGPKPCILVEGRGVVCNCFRTSPNKFHFKIFIYKKWGCVHGKIEIKDECGRCLIKSDDLESYTTSCRRNAVAVFDYEDPRTGACKPLTVYAKEGYCGNSAKLFIYSAPLDRNEIRLGGCVDHGFVKIK